MKGRNYSLAILFTYFVINVAHAICVKNDTDFDLYYEIFNKNTGCPVPKEKFHNGTLSKNQKNCHAHSPKDGDDWKIYRKDLIKVYKFDIKANKKEIVCNKQVNGILNTLEVSFISGPNSWWCLDRSDHQD